jgi:very-short-patch-repair endonuclease
VPSRSAEFGPPAPEQITRSDLEILFKDLCRTHHLPEPRVNQPVAEKHVDFLFPEQRLIVETDSWRYSHTRRAFEDDRARDVLTTTAGYRTLRFSDRQAAGLRASPARRRSPRRR